MNSPQQYVSHSVFGTSSAVCFNGTHKDNTRTINIDFADVQQGRANWGRKISLMVSDAEVPYVIGVLLGIIPSFEGRFHGTGNNKSFALTMQNDGLYLQASEPGRNFAIKAKPADVFHITSLVLGHLKPNFYGLNVDEIGRLVRCTVGRLAA